MVLGAHWATLCFGPETRVVSSHRSTVRITDLLALNNQRHSHNSCHLILSKSFRIPPSLLPFSFIINNNLPFLFLTIELSNGGYTDTSPSCQTRRRRMEIRRISVSVTENTVENNRLKRQKLEKTCVEMEKEEVRVPADLPAVHDMDEYPKFGHASVCGRRRDMEDAVAIHPLFCRRENDDSSSELHYFGVYDGHGCSHVAMRCKDRLHELVKEELENKEVECTEWKKAMEQSFSRMDSEVVDCKEGVLVGATCRCELRTPESDAVGSTAVVALVTLEKIIVANCGDSRAVLCRNGEAIPLSIDHKPDRPDELKRIQASGGRVMYWEGARVLGVLAMSRAIGDSYLKPYVSCEPEVTITDRTAEDDCLILASDGLWDVVSNDTACNVARMCLKGKVPEMSGSVSPDDDVGVKNTDQACSDASMLLTKLALARRSSDNVSVVVIDLRKNT